MIENYKRLDNGVIQQISKQPFKYGFDYSNNYNRLGELGKQMAFLRLGYLLGCLGKVPHNILDIGYGNGDFLCAASQIIPDCYGSDITNEYTTPAGVKFVNTSDISNMKFDVICMFDVLEHFDNIYDIEKMNTEYFYISLPNCSYKSDEWFYTWKHRKPDEHLWHFDKDSLISFMKEVGYTCVTTSYIEDTIRKNTENTNNILTGLFKKI